jgi:hypothetical protein
MDKAYSKPVTATSIVTAATIAVILYAGLSIMVCAD